MGGMSLIIETLIFFLPSYVANGLPVISCKIFKRRHPIDLGKNFIDGRRVLGDNKTIEGFFIGLLSGLLVGLILTLCGLHVIESSIVLVVGTLLGDLIGSFIKRRISLKPGSPLPLLDQMFFLVTAIAFHHIIVGPIEFNIVLYGVLITPILHVSTNFIAYKLGLKSVPW